jgi:hypothetical protein
VALEGVAATVRKLRSSNRALGGSYGLLLLTRSPRAYPAGPNACGVNHGNGGHGCPFVKQSALADTGVSAT